MHRSTNQEDRQAIKGVNVPWRIYIVSNRQPCLEQSEVSLLVVTQVGGVDVTPVNINQKWITQIETLNIQLANKAEKAFRFR